MPQSDGTTLALYGTLLKSAFLSNRQSRGDRCKHCYSSSTNTWPTIQ